MKIIVLKEGNYTVGKNKEFTLMENSTNVLGIKVAVQPFLIITANDFIYWTQDWDLHIMRNR